MKNFAVVMLEVVRQAIARSPKLDAVNTAFDLAEPRWYNPRGCYVITAVRRADGGNFYASITPDDCWASITSDDCWSYNAARVQFDVTLGLAALLDYATCACTDEQACVQHAGGGVPVSIMLDVLKGVTE